MNIDAWKPVSGKGRDAFRRRVSSFNPWLASVQDPHAPQQWKVYGDAAYPLVSLIRRGLNGANLIAARKAFNHANSSPGISVEWAFGKVVQLFPFIDFRKNLNVFLQPVGKYYISACHPHQCSDLPERV